VLMVNLSPVQALRQERNGRSFAAGMFEFDDAPESDLVRQRLFSMGERWRGQLTQLVNEVIASGEFRRDLDATQFVWELCGIYLNHHASHRFIRDPPGP
jgi:hypothetical protein